MMQNAGTATDSAHGVMLQMVGQLSSGDIQAAWETAGTLGIQGMSGALISQFVSQLGPQINMAAGQIPEGIAWALRSGIPEVQAAANALVAATVIPQIQAAVPQISFATGNIPQEIVNGLNSGIPEIRQATADAMTGILQQFAADQGLVGTEAENLVGLIKSRITEGDYSDTGSAPANAILASIGESLNNEEIDVSGLKARLQEQLAEGAFVNFKEQAGPAGEEAGDAAGSAAREKISQGIKDGATDGTSWANDVINAWTPPSKTFKIEPQATETQVTIKVGPGSGYGPLDWWVNQFQNKIAGAGASTDVTVGITGAGAGAGNISNLQNVMKMFGALEEGGALYQGMHAEFKKVEEAISGITGASGPHLEAWRALRAEYDSATERLERYNKAMEDSKKRIEDLQREQQDLEKAIQQSNEAISAANDEITRLSQLKLTGETEADEESYQMGLKLLMLQKEREEIQLRLDSNKGTKEDIERHREIEALEKELQAKKSIHDLETQITYEPQHREIEKVTDELYGEEEARANIINQIGLQQHYIEIENDKIEEQEEALKKIEKQLEREEKAQWLFKETINQTSWEVDNLRAHVDEFARFFTQVYDTMTRDALGLADAIAQSGATIDINTTYTANPTFQHPADLVKYVNRTLDLGLKSQKIPILAPVPDIGVVAGSLGGGGGGVTNTDNSSRTEIFHIDKVVIEKVDNLDDIARLAKLKAYGMVGQ